MRYCPLTQVGLNNAWISRVRGSTVSTDNCSSQGLSCVFALQTVGPPVAVVSSCTLTLVSVV